MAVAISEMTRGSARLMDGKMTLLDREAAAVPRTLPSPEQLAEYERLMPGAGERIIKAHIESLSAPSEMSWRMLDEETRKYRITVVMFSLVPITFGLLAFFLATMQMDGPSIAAFITAAVAMVAVTCSVFKLFKPGTEKS